MWSLSRVVSRVNISERLPYPVTGPGTHFWQVHVYLRNVNSKSFLIALQNMRCRSEELPVNESSELHSAEASPNRCSIIRGICIHSRAQISQDLPPLLVRNGWLQRTTQSEDALAAILLLHEHRLQEDVGCSYKGYFFPFFWEEPEWKWQCCPLISSYNSVGSSFKSPTTNVKPPCKCLGGRLSNPML